MNARPGDEAATAGSPDVADRLSRLVLPLRGHVTTLLGIEERLGASDEALRSALEAGRDGCRELVELEVAAALHGTVQAQLRELAAVLAGLLDRAG